MVNQATNRMLTVDYLARSMLSIALNVTIERIYTALKIVLFIVFSEFIYRSDYL